MPAGVGVNEVFASLPKACYCFFSKKRVSLLWKELISTKSYKLLYNKEAPRIGDDWYYYPPCKDPHLYDDGWEKWSLPLGNGYMGVNVFGRTETERLQITENSLSNPATFRPEHKGFRAGLNNFCEFYIDFGHEFEKVSDYRRKLSLNDAIATTEYSINGVR